MDREEHEKVLKIRPHPEALGKDYYSTLSAVLLHLLRDWGPECEDNVVKEMYEPMVNELLKHKPITAGEKPPTVFVPGSGLSRLPYELMMAGYDVECNENSKIFVTLADYIFNHCSKTQSISPMSHIFVENMRLSDQFFQTQIPSPLPRAEALAQDKHMTMSVGDMVEIYQKGGSGHRKVDCVMTCFFIDTCDDLIDYVETIDNMLNEGGVWINFGPLNYQPTLKLKLVWEEMRALWEHLGYDFVQESRVDHCYNLKHGIRLHTERYDAVFSTAIKGTRKAA